MGRGVEEKKAGLKMLWKKNPGNIVESGIKHPNPNPNTKVFKICRNEIYLFAEMIFF
jgi:hypothetical protein